MHRTIIRGLLELKILIPGPSKNSGEALVEELFKQDISPCFYPHGLGHQLGLDVHDLPGKASRPAGPSKDPKVKYLRLRRELVENMVCYLSCFRSKHTV